LYSCRFANLNISRRQERRDVEKLCFCLQLSYANATIYSVSISIYEQKDKILEKVLKTPTPSDITIEQLITVLKIYGIQVVRRKSSHVIFEKIGGEQWQQLVIPISGKHIKTICIKQVREVIMRMIEEEKK